MLMLGAVLEQAGHEVHILDANAAYRRMTSEQIAAEARELQPDVIGVTIVTPVAREAYRMAGLLRGSGARLLAGGPHATLLPEEPLDHGFDAVAVGEGEPIIDGAVRALMGDVPWDEVCGLVYRDQDGHIRRTLPSKAPEDLDLLPFPARHLADPRHYGPLAQHAVLFSSRGCTARCTYCAGGLFGRQFRFRSAANVLAEIRELHATYGTRHYHFCDDSMSLNRDRFREICTTIVAEKLPITWSMMTRIDAVDQETLRLAAASGCTRIDYGVESGSANTLRKIRKRHNVQMVRQVVPMTKAHGIEPSVFFILGFPWEDTAAIEETRALIEELRPYVEEFHPALGSILVPFPSTELYESYREEYGFDGWWLGTERNFDAPRHPTHAYFEQVLFRNGAILDADFFRYSPDVRAKIIDVFKFMYFSNLRQAPVVARYVKRALFSTSLMLSPRWPRAEARLFGVLGAILEAARRRPTLPPDTQVPESSKT
jgi:anaerobic magnesium-protoporphyrin IX monomethyl ester cyclase